MKTNLTSEVKELGGKALTYLDLSALVLQVLSLVVNVKLVGLIAIGLSINVLSCDHTVFYHQ